MKNLKDVLEKLKVDDIVPDAKFPIDETEEDIIVFLKHEGFETIKQDTDFPSKVFNSKKGKCFYTSQNRIFFADTSKRPISKNNPMFFIYCTFDYYNVYYVDEFDETVDIVRNNKKKFLEELNKRFGWE